MRSMKKWEQEVQMKIHKDKIKRARYPLRSSTKTLHTTNGSQRISTTGILIGYLREFGLQQHYRVALMLEFGRPRIRRGPTEVRDAYSCWARKCTSFIEDSSRPKRKIQSNAR
ncbi:unnamed protein product [Blepharisma stoltei]|uniref:Uncharacterized protein n=1 Tax=Blepharisma stoltei TaxID=1481888 RepID=A0AAU9JL75_9CILI|nr:unnamed protein product [Blepharisma stoltei]